jgi:hypothetical protein
VSWKGFPGVLGGAVLVYWEGLSWCIGRGCPCVHIGRGCPGVLGGAVLVYVLGGAVLVYWEGLSLCTYWEGLSGAGIGRAVLVVS